MCLRNIISIEGRAQEHAGPPAHAAPIPTHPRASTREHAVVGVGGAPRPMKERVRPCERKVDTRGVDSEGKGTGTVRFDMRVMVDGVRVVSVGEGGKTKSVWDCEGVAATARTAECVCLWPFGGGWRVLRRWSGGGAGFRDSVRRRGGSAGAGATGATATATGEEGTGGRIPSGGGRRFPLTFNDGSEGRSNVDFVAVAGGGMLNAVLWAGAEGGGRAVDNDSGRVGGRTSIWERCTLYWASSSGEMLAEVSSRSGLELRCQSLRSSNPPPTPSRSCSSSSSTSSSLRMLPPVVLLATDPVRLRGP